MTFDFGKKLRKAGYYVYDLPLIKNWHAHTELKPNTNKTNGTFSYFGYNWWDLMSLGKFQNSEYVGIGKLSLPVGKDSGPGYVIINCGNRDTILENVETGDVYNIKKYGKSFYNKIDQNPLKKFNTLVSNYKDNMIQYVRVGDAHYILCNVQQLLSGESNITKTLLFTDLMLASGIVNSEQYYATTGLNAFLEKAERVYDEDEDEEFIDAEETLMQEWVVRLVEQWNYVNPAKNLPNGKKIPFKIHWIWLSKVPGSANPLKPKFAKFMESWISRNPNCEFNLWTDSSEPGINKNIVDYITIRNSNDINNLLNRLPDESRDGIKKMIAYHPNVGSRADSLRQAILYLEGGCYADVNDMECLMPMEQYFDKFDFMAGLEPMMYANNAFVASCKGHEIVKNFLLSIAQSADNFIEEWDPNMETEDKDNLVVSQTGPIAFSSIIFGVLEEKEMPRTCIFPSKFIYSNYEIPESPLSWLSPISLSGHFDARDYLK